MTPPHHNSRYTKPSQDDAFVFYNIAKWLGADGIFVLRHGKGAPEEHLKWHRQRKLASKIFTGSNFNGRMQDTFILKAQNLVKLLEAHESGTALDMQKMFFAYVPCFGSLPLFLLFPSVLPFCIFLPWYPSFLPSFLPS
jgi:hypothetical protein